MRKRGFTLIELMVVIAMVVALVTILLPSIVRARAQAQQAVCMSNARQVTAAVMQYAAESDQYFLPLSSPTGQVGLAPDVGHNQAILALLPYLRNSAVFHCPADPRDQAISYSVSDLLGGTWGSYLKHASRVLDVTNATTTFAVIEETDYHPKVLGDPGGFVVEPGKAWVWEDAPAVLHGANGTCITFVDGHAEYHLWTDARTATLSGLPHLTITPNNPDLTWLRDASEGQ